MSDNYIITEGLLVSYTGKDEEIIIPAEVTEIGSMAFFANDNIKSAVIHSGVKKIGQGAFFNCSNLSRVTIGDGVENIDTFAFRGCTSLKEINLPHSVTDIGPMAFEESVNIIRSNDEPQKTEQPKVQKAVPQKTEQPSGQNTSPTSNRQSAPASSMTTSEDSNFEINNNTLIKYNGTAQKVVIPEGVKHIAFAFAEQPIVEALLPEGLLMIGDFSFNYCERLKEIVIPDSVFVIGRDSFSNCTGLEKVKLGKNVTIIKYDAFMDCKKLREIVIPDSVNTLGWCAFGGCSSLEKAVLPENLTSIEDGLFVDCEKLKEVVIPKGVKYIRNKAFANCTSLEKITLPEGIKSISDGAFYNCSSLREINIPDSVVYIGKGAFEGTEVSVQSKGVDCYYYDKIAYALGTEDGISTYAYKFDNLCCAQSLSPKTDWYFHVKAVKDNILCGYLYGDKLEKGDTLAWVDKNTYKETIVKNTSLLSWESKGGELRFLNWDETVHGERYIAVEVESLGDVSVYNSIMIKKSRRATN